MFNLGKQIAFAEEYARQSNTAVLSRQRSFEPPSFDASQSDRRSKRQLSLAW